LILETVTLLKASQNALRNK